MPQFDVFLSHNSADKPWVVQLKDDLLRYGVSVWLDKDEIRPGELFPKALAEGLANSRAVALIVSPEAMASGWVEAEYYRALSLAQNKQSSLQLIPVILRDAKLPDFAQDRHWVDFRDESAYSENVWRLVWGITGQKPAEMLDLTAPVWPVVQTKPLARLWVIGIAALILVTVVILGVFLGTSYFSTPHSVVASTDIPRSTHTSPPSHTLPAIAASTQAPTPVPEVLASTDTQAPTPTPAPTNTPEPPMSASKATATSTSAPVPLPVTLTPTPIFTPTDTPTSTSTPTLTSSPTIVPVSISPTGVVTTAPPAMTPTPMATSLPALSEPKMVTQEYLGDGVKFNWYWDDDNQLNNERWGYEFRFYAGAKVIATHIISPGQATVNDGQWSYILKDSDHPTWGWVPDCPGRWVVTAALLNEDGTYQKAILPEDTILNISAGLCPPGCNCGDGDGSGKGTPPP